MVGGRGRGGESPSWLAKDMPCILVGGKVLPHLHVVLFMDLWLLREINANTFLWMQRDNSRPPAWWLGACLA